jgi:hypothetical protein
MVDISKAVLCLRKNKIMQKIRRVLFSLLVVLSAQYVAAQDHVTLKGGEVIEGKITETKTGFSIGAMANISVNGEKDKVTKVISYKNGKRYMVNIDNRYFLQPYISGKISAIHVEEDAGHLSDRGNDKDYYMIQKGEYGKLEKIS